MSYLGFVICLIVLIKSLAKKEIAIKGDSVKKKENPFLYWLYMSVFFALGVFCFLIIIEAVE